MKLIIKGSLSDILFCLLSLLFILSYYCLCEAGTWSQTTQNQFKSNTLSNIDTSTSVGDVQISGAYSSDTDTVGLWHLNEGSGNVSKDSSSYSNNGTLQNMEDIDWVSGKFGKGLNFDGSNEYVSINDDASLDMGTNNFTVECWFKANDVFANGILYKPALFIPMIKNKLQRAPFMIK